jgi:hypothetical protein
MNRTSVARHSHGAPQQSVKGSAMTRKTIDFERLGIETCEAFMEGPAAFADFVRTILSIAAPVHALQMAKYDKRPEPLISFIPATETRQ